MAGKTLDEVCTAQRVAWCNGRNGTGTGSAQQTSAASTGASANVATSGAVPVTINGQTFMLTPAPSVPASINTAIAVPDAIFPGNLSDYDTQSTFSPSVSIALALPTASPHALAAVEPGLDVEQLPLCDQIEYCYHLST